MVSVNNNLKSLYIDGKPVKKASLGGKVFFEKHEYDLTVSASEPIIQIGEETTITAKLTDYGDPVEGELIKIYNSQNVDYQIITPYSTTSFDCILLTCNGDGELTFQSSIIIIYDNNNIVQNLRINSEYNWKCVKSNNVLSLLYLYKGSWRQMDSFNLTTDNTVIALEKPVNIISDTWEHFYYEGVTDVNGECSVGYVGKDEATLNIKAEAVNLTATTQIQVNYGLLLTSNKKIIQTGETATLTAKIPPKKGVIIENQTVYLSKIIDDSDLSLDLTASTNIVQAGNTLTLTAKVTDSNDNNIENIIVNLFKESDSMAKELVATLVTDSTGMVSYNYVGVGAGKIDFSAESGILQSGTYDVLDSIVYDDMETEYIGKYRIANNANISYSSEWALSGTKSLKWDYDNTLATDTKYWGWQFMSNPSTDYLDLDSLKGKSVMLEMDINSEVNFDISKNKGFYIQIYYKKTSTSSWAYLTNAILIYSDKTLYQVLMDIPSEIYTLWVRMNANTNCPSGVVYTDNWKLYPI